MKEAAGPRRSIEQRAIELVGLLGGVVGKLRVPLLMISLLPVLPALVLISLALAGGRWFPMVIAVLGLIPTVWLTLRRRQLVAALQPPEAAVADLRATFNAAEVGAQLTSNLRAVQGKKIELRPRKLAGALWRGVKLGGGLYSRFTDVPRLAPFMPGRLRGLAFLGAACGISAAVLAVLAVLGVLVSSFGQF